MKATGKTIVMGNCTYRHLSAKEAREKYGDSLIIGLAKRRSSQKQSSEDQEQSPQKRGVQDPATGEVGV